MIRPAEVQDAQQVLPILKQIFDEMELETVEKLGEKKVFELLADAFSLTDYRYGYSNILVDDIDGKIVSIAVGFPEEKETTIDDALKQFYPKYDIPMNFELFVDKEAQAGEWYLDSLAVLPSEHHKGYGKKMLQYLPEYLRNKGEKIISLSVDVVNQPAQKLYEKIGFKKQGQLYIGSHLYDHMILNLEDKKAK